MVVDTRTAVALVAMISCPKSQARAEKFVPVVPQFSLCRVCSSRAPNGSGLRAPQRATGVRPSRGPEEPAGHCERRGEFPTKPSCRLHDETHVHWPGEDVRRIENRKENQSTRFDRLTGSEIHNHPKEGCDSEDGEYRCPTPACRLEAHLQAPRARSHFIFAAVVEHGHDQREGSQRNKRRAHAFRGPDISARALDQNVLLASE